MVHSLFLILVILLFAPLASTIPLCCLSAVLFVVAWNMSELPHVVQAACAARRRPMSVVLLLTFFLTVFVDLVVAVNVGVIFAALFFMRRMADAVNVEQQIEELPDSGTPGSPASAAERWRRHLQHRGAVLLRCRREARAHAGAHPAARRPR